MCNGRKCMCYKGNTTQFKANRQTGREKENEEENLFKRKKVLK